MAKPDLSHTTGALLAPGKGILAADESVPTITKRFEALGITSTADSRRDYRELLFRAPGLHEYISGTILYDETLRQSTADGTPIPEALGAIGIIPGIKVDTGTTPLAGWSDELVTQGLDGLRERLAEYAALGARFAKWRGVLSIDRLRPTTACVSANAHALARYAALCQEAGIVPIVEPEVLMDGDHTIERCGEVTTAVLGIVFTELERMGVDIETIILKPNMVIAGSSSATQSGVDEVADATLRCLHAAVPDSVPGIAFLSGGQGPDLATAHLAAMNLRGAAPWTLTYSYGRALQDEALAAWAGDPANTGTAQDALLLRARANSEASRPAAVSRAG